MSQNNTPIQACTRCGTELEQPVEYNSVYTRIDETETRITETVVALVHTDETRRIRDEIASHYDIDEVAATRAMARLDPDYLRAVERGYEIESDTIVFDYTDLTMSVFDEREVDSPSGPEDDPGVVKSERREIEAEAPVNALICPTCVRENDRAIWGVENIPENATLPANVNEFSGPEWLPE